MGAKQSTGRISKDEKERRKDVQNHIINQRKSEISAIENHVVSNGNSSIQDIKQVIQATTYAQNQLDRGGKPFNKGDLVAIIVALDNKQVTNIDKLNGYRIEDLNALIRCIIYDTKNFVPNSNNMISNETQPNNVVQQPNNMVQVVQQSNNVRSERSNNTSLVLTNNKMLPPLPPKPVQNNVLAITNTPPIYALVRR